MSILDREQPYSAIPELEKRINELEGTFIDRVFPISSCFYTYDSTYNPNISIGGTWVKNNNSAPYEWERTR